MAFKPRGSEFKPSNLLTTLVNSGLSKDNNPLFQTIQGLIGGSQEIVDKLGTKIGVNDKINLETQVQGSLGLENGGVVAGIYLPDLTDTANITSSGAYFTPFF